MAPWLGSRPLGDGCSRQWEAAFARAYQLIHAARSGEAMRAFLGIFTAILSSIICANAQIISELRCDACTRAGLSVLMWDIQQESVMTDGRINNSKFAGRVYLHFLNTGSTDWRIERVNCHFFDLKDRRMFSRSIDMEKFPVVHDTWNIRSDPFGLPKWESGMKADCWIENAISAR
jgi:hypothetical protein